MNLPRYILEPYTGMKSRYPCPSCNKGKTFSRYIETDTKQHIAPSVGRCNREVNCSYHYTPKQYFQDNNISFDKPQPKQYSKPQPIKCKPVSFITNETLKQSLKGYDTNNFVQFLTGLFGADVTNKLISKYFIGTSKYWQGSTVFWQIDTKGKIRSGKIMLYSPVTGKRIKEPYNHISWVHKALKLPEFELQQCLFGSHLLKGNTKPIAITESEKSAIIASVYLPKFIWLSVGSLTNLTADKCKALQGRNVTLYPDLNCFDKWKAKVQELKHIANFTVSDLLELNATDTEREQGFDLADYLIRFKPPDQKEYAEAIQAFEYWLLLNPSGGTFEFEQKKFRVTKKMQLHETE